MKLMNLHSIAWLHAPREFNSLKPMHLQLLIFSMVCCFFSIYLVDAQPQTFQKTKERRSFRGRVAALVRQRIGAYAAGEAGSDATKRHMPKTFGIPFEQCVMSNTYEVLEHCSAS